MRSLEAFEKPQVAVYMAGGKEVQTTVEYRTLGPLCRVFGLLMRDLDAQRRETAWWRSTCDEHSRTVQDATQTAACCLQHAARAITLRAEAEAVANQPGAPERDRTCSSDAVFSDNARGWREGLGRSNSLESGDPQLKLDSQQKSRLLRCLQDLFFNVLNELPMGDSVALRDRRFRSNLKLDFVRLIFRFEASQWQLLRNGLVWCDLMSTAERALPERAVCALHEVVVENYEPACHSIWKWDAGERQAQWHRVEQLTCKVTEPFPIGSEPPAHALRLPEPRAALASDKLSPGASTAPVVRRPRPSAAVAAARLVKTPRSARAESTPSGKRLHASEGGAAKRAAGRDAASRRAARAREEPDKVGNRFSPSVVAEGPDQWRV